MNKQKDILVLKNFEHLHNFLICTLGENARNAIYFTKYYNVLRHSWFIQSRGEDANMSKCCSTVRLVGTRLWWCQCQQPMTTPPVVTSASVASGKVGPSFVTRPTPILFRIIGIVQQKPL